VRKKQQPLPNNFGLWYIVINNFSHSLLRGIVMWLSALADGVKAAIEDIAFEAEARLRLQAMGLGIGQEVSIVRKSHGRGPMMLRSGGSYLMVRHQDAEKIRVRKLP
jgi:Fe2+ transport system protein FeoA